MTQEPPQLPATHGDSEWWFFFAATNLDDLQLNGPLVFIWGWHIIPIVKSRDVTKNSENYSCTWLYMLWRKGTHIEQQLAFVAYDGHAASQHLVRYDLANENFDECWTKGSHIELKNPLEMRTKYIGREARSYGVGADDPTDQPQQLSDDTFATQSPLHTSAMCFGDIWFGCWLFLWYDSQPFLVWVGTRAATYPTKWGVVSIQGSHLI